MICCGDPSREEPKEEELLHKEHAAELTLKLVRTHVVVTVDQDFLVDSFFSTI